MKNQIKDINIKIDKKEDDIKNIVNEKDIIIKNLNDKIYEQGIIIEDNSIIF